MRRICSKKYSFVYGVVLGKDTLLECGIGNAECGFFKGFISYLYRQERHIKLIADSS
jgi:hypothetical protein